MRHQGGMEHNPSPFKIDRLDRRQAARLPMTIEVELHLPTGIRSAEVMDMSRTGAQLRLADPPSKGANTQLVWPDNAHYGTVVWSNAGVCGIKFDKAIAEEAVIKTADRNAAPRGPAAELGNIAVGKKRERHIGPSADHNS